MCSKKFWLVFLITISPYFIHAQGYNLSGTILDETDGSPLAGVTVVINPINDSSKKTGMITDEKGNFLFQNIAEGRYRFRASYIGFENYFRRIEVSSSADLGAIKLKVQTTQLQNITIREQQIRAQQSGDTTSFNAGAYKTNPDANADDLINKMPGITSEGGTVKAQGENVRKVLVDGKPFFGDDPNAALKNLPAEIIDKIQVFDNLSDQSRFTGFDDGQSEKTINIITRPGKNRGQFGKLFGGYGIADQNNFNRDNLYIGGGNLNFFKGNRRISIIALTNNINQQNFSTEDLAGVVNSSSGHSRGGSRDGGRGGSGGYSRGGNNASNFMVGQQDGITTTHSAGINYTDSWGKKINVNGSYFFNQTKNDNSNFLTRNYFTGADSNLVYKENSFTTSKNINHRLNFRFDYEIDSFNSLLITPRLSYQDNEYSRILSGRSVLPDSTQLSRTENNNSALNKSLGLNNNILYRHRFAKKGRTISFNLGTQYNDRDGDGRTYSLNEFQNADTTLLDQQYDLVSNGYTISGSLNYTEPISEQSQLMFSYNPSYNSNHSDKQTMNKDGNGSYSDLDTFLSNKYDNTYLTQRGGLSYRYNDQKMNLNFGLNYQHAVLNGEQEFPFNIGIERSFSNLLPNGMFNYRFTKTKNLRIMYRTGTDAPNISQLQNVVDISNPLLLKTGNPSLEQSYQHTMIFRYGATNTTTSTSFFAFLYGNFVQDYIGNSTIIPTKDTLIDNILVNRGVQLSRPENLDGYYNARSLLTYGTPIKLIKSNLNLSGGINFNRIPALINNTTNFSNNYSLNGSVVLGSNISENLDFTLAYNGNYNIVRNTLQTQSDNDFYSQSTSFRFNWIFLKGFVFNTSLNHSYYSGLTQGFNQSFLLLNASLGYKFLKDRSLDVRISAFDILNQNRAISRTVTETYIEDNFTNVLQRYFMLNVAYTLRRFGSSVSSQESSEDQFRNRAREMMQRDGRRTP